VARDVEVDITANDKTGPALKETEEGFRRSQDRILKDKEAAARREEASFKRSQERMRKEQERIVKKQQEDNLKTLGGFAKLAQTISPKFAQSLGASLGSVAAQIGPILVGAGLAAAPLLGATISGAIIGGAGIGGVVGGILIASRDPRVESAAAGLKAQLGERLKGAAEPFVATTIAGIGRIDQALKSIDFEGVFKNSSRFVAPLADGIGRAIESLGNGLESLVANAGPVINSIAAGIASIGQHLGDGLKSLSDNGESASAALTTIFGLINSGIDTTFNLVNALTELYGIAHKLGFDFVLQTYLAATGAATKDLGTSTKQAGANTNELAAAAAAAQGPVQGVAEQLRNAANAALGLYGAETSAATAMANANATIKKNGETLALNSAKGRENRDAISQVASALQRQYDEYVAVNGTGPQTAAVADNLRAKFISLAQKTGLSASAAQTLANKILGIPKSHDTKLTANTHDAEARAKALQDKINAVHGKTVTITITYRRVHDNADKLKGAASTSWSAAGAAAGTSRTGGPTEVSVDNTLLVSFDGGPYRQYATRVAANERRRSEYKQRVGPR
jgi:hypothetical protein